MPELKLPDWTGGRRDLCKLDGPWSAECKCRTTAQCLADDGLHADDVPWDALVYRAGDYETAFFSDDHVGEIIGGDMARAICEAVIRQALRADAAEERVRGLLCEDCLDGVPLSADRRYHVDGDHPQECRAYAEK